VVASHVLSTRRAIPPTPKTHRLRKSLTSVLTLAAVTALVAPMALPAFAYTPDEEPVSYADVEDVTVEVSDTAQGAVVARPAELAAARAAAAAATRRSTSATYRASSAAQAGDDYPWREAGLKQLSPLRYIYRECVDFVVWRLNRDVGSTSAPFAYTWSYLTPDGGNARDFKRAWEKHGWGMSNSPVAGDIAWWANNHVAYVKEVYADGSVFLEEYNATPFTYSTRTIPASKVDLFLSPPPR
jgi:surface antigen